MNAAQIARLVLDLFSSEEYFDEVQQPVSDKEFYLTLCLILVSFGLFAGFAQFVQI
jgi:hypothetical protein